MIRQISDLTTAIMFANSTYTSLLPTTFLSQTTLQQTCKTANSIQTTSNRWTIINDFFITLALLTMISTHRTRRRHRATELSSMTMRAQRGMQVNGGHAGEREGKRVADAVSSSHDICVVPSSGQREQLTLAPLLHPMHSCTLGRTYFVTGSLSRCLKPNHFQIMCNCPCTPAHTTTEFHAVNSDGKHIGTESSQDRLQRTTTTDRGQVVGVGGCERVAVHRHTLSSRPAHEIPR
jgi:hypothetical protein